MLRRGGFEGRQRDQWALACSATLLALAAPGPAPAADLRASAPAPAFIDWSGSYLGIQGSAGASFGAYDFGPTTIGTRAVPAFRTGDATGRSDAGRDATVAVGGVFGGWNWQTGPWLTGLEADVIATNVKRPVPSSVPGFGYEAIDPPFPLIRDKTDVLGAGRVRLGFAYDRNLVYASVGLTGANARVLATYPDLAGGPVASARRDLSYLGFTLGAGVQVALSPDLSLGLDYRYGDLGDSRRFDLGSVPGPVGGPVSGQPPLKWSALWYGF